MGICELRQQRRIPLDVVQCNEVLRRNLAQGAAREGMMMMNLTDNQPVWLKKQTPRLPAISPEVWCLIGMFFGGPNTPWKFNIAPENIPSQKESSLPTIIFQGLC